MKTIRFLLIKFILFLYLLSVNLTAEENFVTAEKFSFMEAGHLAVAASEELRYEYRKHFLKEGAWAWGRRAYFPQLSVSASEDDRHSQIGSDSFIKSYSVSAEQLLWDGGRLILSRRMEKAELGHSLVLLGNASQDIAENAISLYRQILFNRRLLEIRENALISLEEQRLILIQELELGLVLPIDMAAAEITIAEAKIELIAITISLDELEATFVEILGLDAMPMLSEEIDTEKPFYEIPSDTAHLMAINRNTDLKTAKLSLDRLNAEARAASLSWLPTIKLNGSFGVSGQHYPLHKYNWSVGITMEFTAPWLQGRVSGNAGWDPPYERNAGLAGSVSPLPNPLLVFSSRNMKILLELERTNYNLAVTRIGRMAEQYAERCSLLNKKRLLAVEALRLEKEKYQLSEIRLGLGRITRVQLMEARLEYAAKEAAALEAAMTLLEAERELERMLNLNPGELILIRSVL